MGEFGFNTKLGTNWHYNLIPYQKRLFSPIFIRIENSNPKRISYHIRFLKYDDYIDVPVVGQKEPRDYEFYKGASAVAMYLPHEQPPGTPLLKKVLTDLANFPSSFALVHKEDYLEEDLRTAMYRIEELNEKCKEYLEALEHTETEEQQDITNI